MLSFGSLVDVFKTEEIINSCFLCLIVCLFVMKSSFISAGTMEVTRALVAVLVLVSCFFGSSAQKRGTVTKMEPVTKLLLLTYVQFQLTGYVPYCSVHSGGSG